MPDLVKVDDFEVFRLFRVALLKFAQAAEQSLSNADSQIAGIHSWLESEQSTYWQGQLRKRTEAVARARDAVRQKKLYKDSSGRYPSAVEEEKALAKCLAAVAQAEEKIQLVRKWLPRLEKETEMYRGGVARLAGDVSADIPRAVALLDRLAESLEQYAQIDAPSAGMADSGAVSTSEESMSRGGDLAAEAPVTPVSPQPSTEQEASAAPMDGEVRKEGGHVADGK